MYTHRKLSVLVASFCFIGQIAVSFAAPEAVPGEFLIKLSDKVDVVQMMTNIKGISKRIIPGTNIVVVERSILERPEFVIETLSLNPDVEVVEPNYIYRINLLPNDQHLEKLWGLVNTRFPGVDVGAEQAWDIQTGSPEIVVAVIDTGIDTKIPDLVPNLWVNEVEVNGKTGVDDDGNGFIDDINGYDFVNNSGKLIDDHGHGSHCAGTIGARGNDGHGVAGVAWNIRLMGVKFLGKSGGTLENAIKAINYAVQMKAKISNNSWGGEGNSEILKEAIQKAHEAGMLFVAAAGNEGSDNDKKPVYPANFDVPNILSVAAIDKTGELAYFSCYGAKTVDVAAPGVDIYSTAPNGFQFMSGTSMATPHVSGIAALVASSEPTLLPVEIIERIIRTAKPMTSLRNKVVSSGIANAYYAVTNQVSQPDPNDPAVWTKVMPFSYSTAHPYTNSYETSFEVSVSGATKIAIHFTKFETEKRYDKVSFWTPEGVLLGEMDGSYENIYSPVIQGNSVIVKFSTDKLTGQVWF